jgi:hypothetical protein
MSPAARTVPAKRKTGPTVLKGKALFEAASQYLVLKEQRETIQKKEEEIKADLKASIEEFGYDDADGHQYLDLPSPIGKITGLKRERRATQSLNEDKAEGFVKAKGLWLPEENGGVVEVIEVINQDLLLRAHYDGKLTEKELDSLFTTKVTFALVTVRS